MVVKYRDKQWTLDGQWTVRDVIREVGLVPTTVLPMRDGKLLTEDVILEEDDEVRLVPVISGG